MRIILLIIALSTHFCHLRCESQAGPDPWHNENNLIREEKRDEIVPPDLRVSSSPKSHIKSGDNILGDWFLRRMLALVLKGGQYKINEDASVDVSLLMRFDDIQWSTLNQYLSSKEAFTEEMFRRSVGYVETAIYKPSISEKIAMAWQDHIHYYLKEYHTQITITLGILAAVGATLWLWNHMSHKHLKIIIFMALYLYEVFVSYKEADQKEFERYMSVINTCKWYFWSSTCEVQPPDPTIILKHMNPLKIGIRMFTTFISEPMIVISTTMQTIIHGMTDGLWYPLDKIINGLLAVFFNVILVVLLIIILFTYILNIPFNLSFLAGFVSFGVNQGSASYLSNNNNNQNRIDHGDRIPTATVNKMLDVVKDVLKSTHTNVHSTSSQSSQMKTLQLLGSSRRHNKIPRSSSTGRLQDLNLEQTDLDNSIRKRSKIIPSHMGGGDALFLYK